MLDKNEWLKLLKNREAWCYFKLNRKKHESGWKCFEIGYMTVGDDKKMKDKIILGNYSDHIQPIDYFNDNKIMTNIDATLDGYIRIHSRSIIWWSGMDFVVSSAYITELNNIKI